MPCLAREGAGEEEIEVGGLERYGQRFSYRTMRKGNGIGYRVLILGIRIQTWALEEARRRLEAEGILADPDDEANK